MNAWRLASALLLTGCAALPTRNVTVEPVQAEAAQRLRAETLGLEAGECLNPGWAMAGRVALSNGKQGGSGQIEWTQGAGELRLMLTAPVTRQGWVLQVNAHTADLQTLADGAHQQDADAALLLRRVTGWDVPVAALGCWLRAVSAETQRFGTAQLQFNVDMLPTQLQQAGWTVRYDDWRPDPFTGLPMPMRIEAVRGSDRVRLVVSRWGVE